MGWTTIPFSTRKQIIRERLENYFLSDNDNYDIHSVPLKHCYRGGNFSGVLWIVWEITKVHKETREVIKDRFIECDLLQYYKGDNGWGYKDMCEDCGPCYYSCPLSYIDMVPYSTTEIARKWKEKVREYHMLRSQNRKKKKNERLSTTLP